MNEDPYDLLVKIAVVIFVGIIVFFVKLIAVISRIRKDKKANSILAEADKLFQAGNCKAALELTEEAARLDVRVVPLVHFRKAALYDKLGDPKKARPSYELFLRKSPIATHSPEIDMAKKRIVELGGSL